MNEYRFTTGTPDQRRAWVNTITAELREEAGVHRQVAARLERWARQLDTCDAEAGAIPIRVLAYTFDENIGGEPIAALMGLSDDAALFSVLRKHHHGSR